MDSILTLKEVARYLRVAERTVYRLATASRIPAFKIGRTWRFSRAEIDSWIKLQISGSGRDVGQPGEMANPAATARGESKC